jgi:hypothetical protein
MRKLLFLVLMGVGLVGKGMYMSPDYDASFTGIPILNNNVHVFNQVLTFKPDENFVSGKFTLESDFEVTSDSVNIPFLFYVFEGGNSPKFQPSNSILIWIDGKLMNNMTVADYEKNRDSILWTNFQVEIDNNNSKYRSISLDPYGMFFDELLLFDSLIGKGYHHLKLEYLATSAAEFDRWLINRAFEFNLEHYIKRETDEFVFKLDGSDCKKEMSFNFLGHDVQTSGEIKSWKIKTFSNKKLTVNYNPELGKFSAFLVALDPNLILILIFALLLYIHISWIIKYRKINFHKRFSVVAWLGSWLCPIIVAFLYVFYIDFVDFTIGDDAAENHHALLIIIFYPFVMPVYWLVISAIDIRYRDKFRLMNEEKSIE